MAKALIIGEPGGTHEGSKEKLLELLHTAKECGADVFKPQWVSDPAQMCERRHIGVDHPKRAYYQRVYSWLNFQAEWHADLKALCVKAGMKYAVSCFLPQDVATVSPFVDYLKVSAFEAADPLMRHEVVRSGHQAIVSLGGGVPLFQVVTGRTRLLHCVQSYPAPLSSLNLGVLPRYDGYSDHSRHLLAGALAVACGASIVETHFRLESCNVDNPDYVVSFTPSEFAQYIRHIRDAELMLGNGVKQLQPCEAWALPYRVIS
jgi:sialic acid synthase SpsE